MGLGAVNGFFLFVAACAVWSLVAHWNRAHGEIRARLTTLELKLDKILDHLGLEHDMRSAQVEQLRLRGLKIEAIKLYREQHGTGLLESKEAVERIVAGLKDK